MKTKYITKLFFILPILIFLLKCPFLNAETSLDSIEKISLAEESMWPPFTYQLDGAPNRGLSLDLMKEIFSRIGLKYDLKLYPMNRVVHLARKGKIDAITAISKNTEREQFLVFSKPHTIVNGLLVYSAERTSPIEWEEYKDLKQYTIGIVQGHNYGKEFNIARNEYELHVDDGATSIENNFQKLYYHRIDILLVNQIEFSAYLNKNPKLKSKYKTTINPYNTSIYRIGFSLKSPAIKLIPKINKVIERMHLDGTLKKIHEKYNID